MPARDANNATWHLLRYAADFTPQGSESGPPLLGAELFYDEARHVLELLPRGSGERAGPAPAVAVDVDGEVYRGDLAGRVWCRRCDGSEVALGCDPGTFLSVAGLALDRRGLLFVADPRARRVVVISPDDGRVRGRIGEGLLVRPVDVAIAPGGRVYVADAGSGHILEFSAGLILRNAFVARNAAGLPDHPEPVAVMVASDGSLLVADALHPRLLHFSPEGHSLGDVALAFLVAMMETLPAEQSLSKAYGSRLPRFVAGVCGPPWPEREGGLRLAEVHRSLRLTALRLGQSYATEGVFVSRVLDSGRPGTVWHRVLLDADIPAGTSVTVETVTADQRADLLPAETSGGGWQAPRDAAGRLLPITEEVPDQLVQSGPGRYLRLRVTLRSNGEATPSLRFLKVLYPRVSYLDLLPPVYRRDADGALFLERFLALFERVFTRVEDRYEAFSQALNPDAAPREVIDWLACLVDLSFDPSWPVERRRALVAAAMELYRRRGTVEGLTRYVQIYTGIRPVIIEEFLRRPARATCLGRHGCVLGCTVALRRAVPGSGPDELLYRDYAHRFTVVLTLQDACDRSELLPVVERIVSVNRPAHTAFTLRPVFPETRVGLQSTVGIDTVLGGRAAPRTRLGETTLPAAPHRDAAILGIDSVLGDRRPQYVRPIEPGLHL